jgi:hypothetical protein
MCVRSFVAVTFLVAFTETDGKTHVEADPAC